MNGLATLTAQLFLWMNSTYSFLFHRDTAVPFARPDTVREHKHVSTGSKHKAAQPECRTSEPGATEMAFSTLHGDPMPDTCLHSCTKKTQTMANRALQRFTQVFYSDFVMFVSPAVSSVYVGYSVLCLPDWF